MQSTTAVRETLGRTLGEPLGSLRKVRGRLRETRIFHRVGEVFLAESRPIASNEPLARQLGRRLQGATLVRLSNGLWSEGKEWPDLLGCALRFGWRGESDARPDPGEQDLLMRTARRRWSLPFAIATTDVHNFLANCYYGVSPFRFRRWSGIELRMVPIGDDMRGRSRWEILESAVRDGAAIFRLDVRHGWLRGGWEMAARITLRERLSLDQRSLRFSPLHAGAELVPEGFVRRLTRAA